MMVCVCVCWLPAYRKTRTFRHDFSVANGKLRYAALAGAAPISLSPPPLTAPRGLKGRRGARRSADATPTSLSFQKKKGGETTLPDQLLLNSKPRQSFS